MSLQGKIITVTGGGRGIGLATARLLASRGATLSIADSDPATLNEVEKEFQEKQWPALFAVVDVRKRSQVDSWIDETVRKFGRLDAAANIAGTQGKQCMQAPVADIDDEDWELVLGVNLTGLMYCLRAELKHLVDGGSIVNVSSVQGRMGGPGCSAYATSKHGVIGLTRCAARDYGHRGIRVNVVAPGGTTTPMFKEQFGDSPPPTGVLGRFAEPGELEALSHGYWARRVPIALETFTESTVALSAKAKISPVSVIVSFGNIP